MHACSDLQGTNLWEERLVELFGDTSTDTHDSNDFHTDRFIRLMESLLVSYIHSSSMSTKGLQKVHCIRRGIIFLFTLSTVSSLCSLCTKEIERDKDEPDQELLLRSAMPSLDLNPHFITFNSTEETFFNFTQPYLYRNK